METKNSKVALTINHMEQQCFICAGTGHLSKDWPGATTLMIQISYIISVTERVVIWQCVGTIQGRQTDAQRTSNPNSIDGAK